jgi:DNA-binding response OmpR family regulator
MKHSGGRGRRRSRDQAMVRGLTEAGHLSRPTPSTAPIGLLEAQKGGWDVYVVDRMMPRLDGIGMVETLRKDGDQTPVLFLSALGEVEDRVTGLKAGADDYLVKPYAFAELIARVEALSRRRETGGVADGAQGRRPRDEPDRPHRAPWHAPRSTCSRASSSCWSS